MEHNQNVPKRKLNFKHENTNKLGGRICTELSNLECQQVRIISCHQITCSCRPRVNQLWIAFN